MTIKLTQKETMLLQDQKKHEEMCIQKYSDYAMKAEDSQLKQLFKNHASQEQQHLNTINDILSGKMPNTQQNQQGQQQGQQQDQSGSQSGGMQNNSQGQPQSSGYNQQDAFLCNDLLMTEKYVSGAYDTAIFEFTDTNIRQTLNHIQKEEQQHGEDIYMYMNSKGMYQPQ
ncbi:spore coat protein [Geosporobacter ferrireducens]|uniref:Coat protein F n=1 Tax=Geosporobacter ferrireducens TaxID=1424294 RepID=A0A1D8GIS9_9FIRM|nr:spore coat protein [Geosporobacter ferrireducens]AOT70801.1 coat protein F [Geosporobacter ferrireducens]